MPGYFYAFQRAYDRLERKKPGWSWRARADGSGRLSILDADGQEAAVLPSIDRAADADLICATVNYFLEMMVQAGTPLQYEDDEAELTRQELAQEAEREAQRIERYEDSQPTGAHQQPEDSGWPRTGWHG